MIVLIVAGGSGTRLWPLSTPDYPKHLLTITGDTSLLQNTFERAKRITSIDKIYISTEQGHSEHVVAQLPELPANQIIVEPARRDTMPCILNALQLISTRHSHDESIASIHADHHIRDVAGFARALTVAGRVSAQHGRICLLGIEPYQPDTKYGYIHKGAIHDGEENTYEIKSFKEKPEYELAKQYFETGEFFWNAGYFVAPYTVFESAIREYADPHWGQQLQRLNNARSAERDAIYLDFQKQPIDTALMERVPNLLVMPGGFDWMDVGSFDDVHKVTSQDQEGNAIVGQGIYSIDNEQLYIRNDCSRPVAVIGLDNITIVNTEHGLLVMRTDRAQKVKDAVNMIKADKESA